MLKCSDNTFYVGHTDDIRRRIAEHNAGKYAGYTSGRLPVRLVYLQDFATRDAAKQAEHTLKKWSAKKKAALVEKDWDRISILAKKVFE